MKKLINLLLCLTLVLALTGCGKEQSATYTCTISQDGITQVDTQILKAKGDIVYQMDEVVSYDFSSFTDEEKEALITFYESTFEAMKSNAPETVNVEYSNDGTVFNVELSMDIENSDLQELIDGGYVASTTDQKVIAISFKQSCEALEASGYTLVEE